ncbi:hypothetical protein GCM10020331_036060 [Ectobacillus funiculus]
MYSIVRMKILDTNEAYEEKKEVIVTGYFPRMHEDEVFLLCRAALRIIRGTVCNIRLRPSKKGAAADENGYCPIFIE